ncbi:MAG: four helix bundle protein [Anaerolineales bacterium]
MRRSAKGVTGNIGEAYGRYHYLDSLRFYSTARGELNETLARLIDARVLSYIQQPEFEELYKLIRQAEQTLNGYMNYVRRQRAGSQEFGDKAIREDQADYDLTNYNDNDTNQAI